MPASRCCSAGCSSSVVNTAIVRSRSRYSSMSRLMNLALRDAAACSYSGVSRSTTRVTVSSKPHIDSWLADRRDLDRHVVDVIARQQLAGCRRAGCVASRSPSTASPSRLMLSRMPRVAQLLRASCRASSGRVDDEVGDHAAQHPARDRDDRPRQDPRESAADRDRRAQVPGQEPRDAVREQFEVLAGDAQVFGPHDLVDEAEGELEAARVFEHAGQALGARVGLHVGAGGEPAAARGSTVSSAVGRPVDRRMARVHIRLGGHPSVSPTAGARRDNSGWIAVFVRFRAHFCGSS